MRLVHARTVSASRLTVTSERPGELPSGNDLQLVGAFLWRGAVRSLDAAIDRANELEVEFGLDFERPTESSFTIPIDGVGARFDVLSLPTRWAAFCPKTDVWVSLDADRFDIGDVELVRVTDPSAYLRSWWKS